MGSYQYFNSLDKDYKQPFLNQQLQTCVNATKAAASISLDGDDWIPTKKIDHLFEIYFGEAALTQTLDTLEKMRAIGNTAVRCNASKVRKKEECSRPIFNGLAFEVAESCRATLGRSWSYKLQDLGKSPLDIVFEPKENG
ncbi:hypothetical protein D3C86_1770030 [compost metagenome]